MDILEPGSNRDSHGWIARYEKQSGVLIAMLLGNGAGPVSPLLAAAGTAAGPRRANLFNGTIDREYGGYSSAAERLTVAQDVVGSIPTSRPR